MLQQKNKRHRSILLAIPMGMALVHGSQVYASESLALEEVIVTARKRAESLQDIPVAATVFGASDLELRGATQVADITSSVPNVSYQDRAGGHQTSIGIRGISSNVRNIGIDDSVGIYVDGVYIGRPMFYNIDLAEVEQIEVLRGPQGTLFGKNTIAGAMNIMTKAVPEELSGSVKATVGNFGLQHFKASVGGMLNDTYGGSLTLLSKQTDGYVKNLYNGDDLQALDQKGAAAKLQINPTDQLSITIKGDYAEKDNDINASQIIVPSSEFFPGTTLRLDDQPGGIFAGQYDPFEINENGPQYYQENVKGASVSAVYDLDNGYSINAIGAWREMNLAAGFDDDSSPVDLLKSEFEDNSEQRSLELRLTSPGGETLDWILGAFYYEQDLDSERAALILDETLSINGSGYVEASSAAIYFNGDYHINHALDLNVGIRYTVDKKKSEWQQFGNGAVIFGLPILENQGNETWEEISPTVALTYALNDDTSVYGKVSRGFKSGGFIADVVTSEGFVLEPETVTSYEMGLKSTLMDGRVQLNTAAFVMDYSDLQTLSFAGAAFVGANAGAATIKGVEADIIFQASERLLLKGGVGFTDAQYDTFHRTVDGVPQDLSGNDMRNAPKLTANMIVEYSMTLGNGGDLAFIGEWSYKDEVFYSEANAEQDYAPGYSLYNARVAFTSPDENWRLSLWGKNLGGKEYLTFLRQSLSHQSGLYGSPRTYGLDITYNF